MTVSTRSYDRSKFSIDPSRHGVTVYYDGAFWENADSFTEAEQDIEDAVN